MSRCKDKMLKITFTCQQQQVRIGPRGQSSLWGWWCVWWGAVCWAGWTGRTPGSPVWPQRCQHAAPQRSDRHHVWLQSHGICLWGALEEKGLKKSFWDNKHLNLFCHHAKEEHCWFTVASLLNESELAGCSICRETNGVKVLIPCEEGGAEEEEEEMY